MEKHLIYLWDLNKIPFWEGQTLFQTNTNLFSASPPLQACDSLGSEELREVCGGMDT